MRRREFMAGMVGAGCISLGAGSPGVWLRAASAAEATTDRVLVVLGLVGGNDGLNSVIPFGDDEYYRRRPSLAVAKNRVVGLNDYLGLHPRMGSLRPLYDAGRLAIVQGVGYPHSNRSHFRATEIWHTGKPGDLAAKDGWLADVSSKEASALPTASIGEATLPLALAGPRSSAPNIDSLNEHRLRLTGLSPAEQTRRSAAIESLAAGGGVASPDLEFLRQTARAGLSQAKKLQTLAAKFSSADYPGTALASKLRTAAELIGAEVGLRVVFLTLDGFDTHAQQQMVHENLLAELADALSAFDADLAARGVRDRVLVATFSEFGRRVQENGGLGTDHGSAGPMFLIGPVKRSGLIGAHPSLTDLDEGDLKHHIDFRSVYATLLEGWLGLPSNAVLGGRFPLLDVL
jgi:uncharacterized protein (DUF1501 family)